MATPPKYSYGKPAPTPAPDPEPEDTLVTVQEEQLKRSAEIEAMGVEKWKEAHDGRLHEPQKAVPGVSRTQI